MPVKTKRGTVKSRKAQTAETAKTAGTVRITTAKAKSAKAGIGKPTPAKTGNAGTKTGNGPVIHTVSGIKTINLALQGGGSHGAFTWGVLDRLLEESRIVIDGISGASAGAMNAVVYADGLLDSGVDGAKTALHDFWKAVSEMPSTGSLEIPSL